MKTLKQFISEAKLTYDQAWNLHQEQRRMLSDTGFEVRSSGGKSQKNPNATRFGYAKSYGGTTTRGESITYDLWVGFSHDNMTRINDEIKTTLLYTTGDGSYTSSPRTLDEKAHKTMKSAMAYIENIAYEKRLEDFANVLLAMNSLPIETIQNRNLFSALYGLHTSTKVRNAQDAIKFVQTIKKKNPTNMAAAQTIAKKYIKKGKK
jgi:hypothetical protein